MPSEPAAMRAVWFPASVTLPDGTTHSNTKIYATDTGVDVWHTTNTGNQLVFRADADFTRTSRPRHPRNGFTIYLTDGDSLTVTASGGCGCGSPLKRFSPPYARKAVRW